MVGMLVLITRVSTTHAGVLHGLVFFTFATTFPSDLIGCSTLKFSDLNYFQYGRPFAPFLEWMNGR